MGGEIVRSQVAAGSVQKIMTTKSTDLSTPEGLMSRFAERLNDGDLDGLVELYEPPAVFEPQPGVIVRGHADIRAALCELLVLTPRLTSTILQVLEADDVALVVNEWALTGQAPDGTEVSQAGRSTDVLRRGADGTWRVIVDKP